MKIYIGKRQLEDESYKQITEPEMLRFLAEDSECTLIVLDGVLRKYEIDSVTQIIALCRQKLRTNGVLKIIDVDFDLLVYVYNQLNNLMNLNKSVFPVEMRSFLSLDLVMDLVKNTAPDLANVQFSRVQNVEFDLELIRK
jgi:hypothetical protein